MSASKFQSEAPSQDLSSGLQLLVDRFEDAWQSGQRPQIDEYLPPENPERRTVLVELVHVDLERRLKAGEAVRVKQYLERYPELAADQAVVLNLLASEFALRRRSEPNLLLEDYLQHFPSLGEALLQRLREIPQEQSAPSLTPASGKDGLMSGRGWFIGKYRVVEQLGSGGQGDVYRAVHPTLGRNVVIKRARENLPEAAQQLLITEGRVLARLEDPGVVRVYDVDLHEGRPFVVFEYVAGRSLAERLKQERLSFREAAALVAELADTLARLHQKGILHRDLKPANVLIDEAGRPRLLDFGLSSLTQHWTAINRPEPGVSGTPAYMAPEQANGQTDHIGPRTDIFNLGALFYELLTGRPPYKGADSVATEQQARAAKITPPGQLNPRIPRALERICMKALAIDPARRFASALQFRTALKNYLRGPRLFAVALGLGMVLALAFTLAAWHQPKMQQSVPPIPPALKGDIDVRISEPGKPEGLHLQLSDKETLPVKVGDKIQVEVSLNREAYLYVVWIDTEGRVTPVDPWKDGKWGEREKEKPRSSLGIGAKVANGPAGMETLLLLAREDILPPCDVQLVPLFDGLPIPTAQSLMAAVRFENGEVVRDEVERAVSFFNVRRSDDPVLRTQRLLKERLKGFFTYSCAVSFANQGK